MVVVGKCPECGQDMYDWEAPGPCSWCWSQLDDFDADELGLDPEEPYDA